LGFFDFVDMSVTGSFTSALYLDLSGIHNFFFSDMYKTTVRVFLKCKNSSVVSAKSAEMQLASGYS